jgi:hypothetical protein
VSLNFINNYKFHKTYHLFCYYIKGQLYAVGGNDGAASLDSCERYDPHLDKWSLMASMLKRRAGAGCAELEGYLYVVGRCLEQFNYFECRKKMK